MIRFFLDTDLLNTLLRRVPEQKVEYRQGCFLAKVKLPIGAVNVVVVPSFNGSHLVLTLPFKEIKGDKTGKFFLSKLVSTFWGVISKQVTAALVPRLTRRGFPRDTVTVERSKEAAGDVGRIKVSARAVNSWLSGKHPRLELSVENMDFTPQGVELQAGLVRLTQS